MRSSLATRPSQLTSADAPGRTIRVARARSDDHQSAAGPKAERHHARVAPWGVEQHAMTGARRARPCVHCLTCRLRDRDHSARLRSRLDARTSRERWRASRPASFAPRASHLTLEESRIARKAHISRASRARNRTSMSDGRGTLAGPSRFSCSGQSYSGITASSVRAGDPVGCRSWPARARPAPAEAPKRFHTAR
jgi:hypothetical protein